MSQIINITSEALQATIRRLLPSQQGFGEDLQASNVITPIIDLTPTAEGSVVRQDLQTALTLDSQTNFETTGSSPLAINPGTGFYRFVGTIGVSTPTASITAASIKLTDGLSTKVVYAVQIPATSTNDPVVIPFDLVFYFNAGESMTMDAGSTAVYMIGSYRQIATVTGELVNPSGFNPQ